MDKKYQEYKVVEVAENGLGNLLLAGAHFPLKKMENTLNQYAAEGWQVIMQVVEKKRFLLFWTRESVVITLGR